MNSAILIVQGIILILGYILFLYLKKLPETLHQKSIKNFEFRLNSSLEELKATLTKEIELAKISQTELQVHKTQEFVRLMEYFNDFLTNKEKQLRLAHSPKEKEQFNKNMLDLGAKLFFFASDSTVKKYIEWRQYGLRAQQENFDSTKILVHYAELMVMIRQDLGYENTKCNADDFLNIMLTDWEQHKLKTQR